MRVRVKHLSRYRYGRPAALGPHLIRLRPAAHLRADLLSYNMEIKPDCEIRWQHDPWGNRLARLTFPERDRVSELRVEIDAAFDIHPVNPFDFYVDDRCETLPFVYPDGLASEIAPFVEPPPLGPSLAAFVESLPLAGYVTDYLVSLNRRVAETVRYTIRPESGIQTSEQTLTRQCGSCRDSAQLLVDVLRSRGIAARFVSGYLVQLADEGNIPDEAKGVDRDVVDLHAWAEAYIPGAGWVGLDGTSGLLCGEGHIPLTCTVTPALAAPISGTASEPAQQFDFEMSVVRLGHEPRPRRPYEDEVWEAIVAAGKSIDQQLADGDIRLTCGGEPTWTSRLHPREPEWQTEALGPTKWQQGLRFAQRLLDRSAPGTLLLRRMGKQYPGESLPRWMLQLLWRTDGVPIWRHPERIALGGPKPDANGTAAATRSPSPLNDRGLAIEQARSLGKALCEALGVAPNLIPAYEDPWHFLRQEQNLPQDIDPLSAELDDAGERQRLARVLGHGLGQAVGFVLPIQSWQGQWITGTWRFRREHLFLIPGDSPLGLRLPLDRLAGTPTPNTVRDPMSISEPLAFDPRAERSVSQPAQHPGHRRQDATRRPTDHKIGHVEQICGPGSLIKTALCIEARGAGLHVFLPPLPTAEAFLELIAILDSTCDQLDLPLSVEGYPPPADHRLQSCLITPDPGVIEVNMPVADSFAEYLKTFEVLSDAANHAGLCTEKYQLDGRQVGSGGGNHITLGGPSPAESPFLKHPQLLVGLLRYLQNHPSLSYLFSGLFVGPTSQAPRVDEARLDALKELELALLQVPQADQASLPWQIDRLLRNLLVDVAGNTHRTEVCIDKLYAPEGPVGRLGLVELRAFEMPPNEKMAAVQILLARALVARSVKRPYDNELIRWGPALHDRFMLPYYLWQDILDVAGDMNQAGVPMDAQWFLPFVDYRFPIAGTLRREGMELELRNALEPWPTLGEQPEGALVSRYVDSSLERLQLRVTGFCAERYQIGVNGWRVPLAATGTEGEFVAGIRFRAWQPPHCLQPYIGVHHPLRFDIVDAWGQRSLGACTYHVWHPEGRAFDEPPLTAFEAAARRAQRFTSDGHQPWPVRLRETTPRPEQPLTLDLRWTGLGPAHQQPA